MLSIPEALLDGIDTMMPFISLLSVQLKENCSHMGCCLGVKRCSWRTWQCSLAKDLILLTVFWPMDTKNWLTIQRQFYRLCWISQSRIFRNAVANSFPDVIGVSRITLDLISDKFSFCKSNFPFYLSPEVVLHWQSHQIVCPFSKSIPGIPFSHQCTDIVSYTRVRFPMYSKDLKRSMLVKNVIKQQVKSIQLIIYVAKNLSNRQRNLQNIM